MVVDFDAGMVQADWHLVTDGSDPESAVDHAASWQSRLGTNRLTRTTTRLT